MPFSLGRALGDVSVDEDGDDYAFDVQVRAQTHLRTRGSTSDYFR